MDGVRLNQPFGDVVSWDLIPKVAIFSGRADARIESALRSQHARWRAVASNQGRPQQPRHEGAGDLRQRRPPRARVRARRQPRASGINWYVAGNLFAEDGWRDDSPSDVRQLFGKLGWGKGRSDVSVSLAYADNSLNGNGLQEIGFLDRDYASVYTKPDETDNQSTFLNVTATRALSDRVTFSVNGYFRDINTDTLNGDINEESLDQALYQPSAAEQAALFAAGYITAPVVGANASNTPFPYLRCVGNVLLNDEPAEKCNGLINRGQSDQRNGGLSGQITLRDASVTNCSRRAAPSIAAASASLNQRSLGISTPIAASPARARSPTARPAARSTASRSTRASISTEPSTRGACSRRTRSSSAISVAPDALGPLQSNDRRQQRPHHARRRTGIARRASRVQPIQPRRRHHLRPVESSQPVRRLQRRKPRGHVDRARMRGPRAAVQAAECDGRRSAARPGRDADVGGRRARRTRPRQLARRLLPRAERRRHPLRDVRADRLRLLPQLWRDATAGHRARC